MWLRTQHLGEALHQAQRPLRRPLRGRPGCRTDGVNVEESKEEVDQPKYDGGAAPRSHVGWPVREDVQHLRRGGVEDDSRRTAPGVAECGPLPGK